MVENRWWRRMLPFPRVHQRPRDPSCKRCLSGLLLSSLLHAMVLEPFLLSVRDVKKSPAQPWMLETWKAILQFSLKVENQSKFPPPRHLAAWVGRLLLTLSPSNAGFGKKFRGMSSSGSWNLDTIFGRNDKPGLSPPLPQLIFRARGPSPRADISLILWADDTATRKQTFHDSGLKVVTDNGSKGFIDLASIRHH
uniref:Uncharacterized protein n=1 Tax=Sphaerodactylus townsendi TaxID=933632 RepID=A0ACB8E5Z2_9SAUR